MDSTMELSQIAMVSRNSSVENQVSKTFEAIVKRDLSEDAPPNEDFVIIENPDFCLQHDNNDASYNQPENGVQIDFLPPPRTLDDAPLRKGRKKRQSYKRRGVGKRAIDRSNVSNSCVDSDDGVNNLIVMEQPEVWSLSSSNNPLSPQPSPCFQSEVNRVDVEAIDLPLSQSQDITRDNDIVLFEDDDLNFVNSRQSTVYNLRKKSSTVDYCNDLLENENELHSTSNPFLCTECQFSFASKKDLMHHQIALHDRKQHVCEECGKGFATAFGLQKHAFFKHSESNKCPLCEKQLRVGQTLITHMKKCTAGKQPEGELLDCKPKSCYPCPHCGRTFSERGNLRRHVRLHQGILAFTCDQCGKKCSEKQALESHIRYMHSGERPYPCDSCSKSFTTNSDLRRHQSVHSDVRRYSCSDCGKLFKTRCSLNTHMKLKKGEKLWQCGVCDQRFMTKNGLKKHMVIHSSIKMFECETCQRKFSHKNSLEAHVRVHTGIMPYSCPICGKKFAHVQNKNRHVRTMHPEGSS